MHISTELALQSFYPPELEVANICQTDTKSILRCLPGQKVVHAPNAGLFQHTNMGLMKENSRIFRF